MAHMLGVLAVITFLLSFQFKNRKNIIAVNLTSRLLYILQYILLGAFEGAVLDFLGLILSFFAGYKEKKFVVKHFNTIIVLVNIILLAIGLVLYKNIFSIFAILGIVLEITALWLTKEKNIRILSLFSAPFWLVYNLTNSAYGSVVGNVLTMVSIGIAMARLDFNKKEKYFFKLTRIKPPITKKRDELMTKSKEVNQYEKMTKWPIPKLVITLGIPTTISMLVTNIYNMADTYFVSELGNSASGAVGVVFGLMAIIQAFGFMFGHGAGSIIARKLGQKDSHSASIFASLSVLACLCVGTVIGVLGLIFIDPLMRVLGSTDTILPFAKQYGIYILIAAPFTMTSFALNNILRYEGKAFFAMIGLTIGGILNMIGDPILIFGFDMGIAGAGLSTAISQVVGFLILILMFFRGKTLSKLNMKFVKEKPKGIFEIMATGFPSLCRQGLTSVATMTLNNLAGGVGGDACVAAISIVNRITFFIFAVGLGIGQGFQPVASFNYGARIYSRVKKAFYFTLVVGEILLGVFVIVGLLFSNHLIGLFRNDPTVIEIGTLSLKLQLLSLFFHPMTICSNMLFQSIGENIKATFLSMLRSGVLFIPILLVLTKYFGLFGVQSAQAIADVLAFFISAPLVLSFLKKLPKDQPELKTAG